MLTRAASVMALGFVMAACDSAPPAPSTAAGTTVVARWVADDGSVVALNVVLGRDADRRRVPELARSLRNDHPDARVILTFFADTAGPERYVMGHVPTDGGPLTDARPSSAIVTFDFPRPSPAVTAGAP